MLGRNLDVMTFLYNWGPRAQAIVVTRLADTNILLNPWSRLITFGDRLFSVGRPRTCDNLPETV